MSEYITTADHELDDIWTEKILPKNSFVCPIKRDYVPTHILEAYPRYSALSPPLAVDYQFCYTRYGIVPLPSKIIRKIK